MVHMEFQQKVEKEHKKEMNSIIFKESLVLENITFRYEQNHKDVLKNINLEIIKGNKIAIMGESGSGKSTLLDLLIGLHMPTSGKMLIDNLVLTHKDIILWRKLISFVPQKVVLFEAILEENITFGKEYNEKLFNKVLKDVFIFDAIMSKDGRNTEIGDEVSGLSGGQMQRIAFARALYQERDILFLDEATSSLDEDIEIKIIDNLLEKYKDKTIIAIVHKKSIASKFDKVINISNGNIF
jgi:ATP-binding cassette, subfamily B, bacterial PglK